MLIDGDKAQNIYDSHESSATTRLIQNNNGDFVDSYNEESEESPKVDGTPVRDQIILASSNANIFSRKESNAKNIVNRKNQCSSRILSHLKMVKSTGEVNSTMQNIDTSAVRGINIGIDTEENYMSTFPSIANRKTSEDVSRTKRRIGDLSNLESRIHIKNMKTSPYNNTNANSGLRMKNESIEQRAYSDVESVYNKNTINRFDSRRNSNYQSNYPMSQNLNKEYKDLRVHRNHRSKNKIQIPVITKNQSDQNASFDPMIKDEEIQ